MNSSILDTCPYRNYQRHGFLAAITLTAYLAFFSEVAVSDAQSDALAVLLDGYDLYTDMPMMENPGTTNGYYVVKEGETLDQIILNTMPKTNIRKSIIKRAFVNANPHAFKRSNPNWMYANKRLKLPDADDIKGVVFKNKNSINKDKISDQDKKTWVSYP
jgi:hypothetical protein